MGGSGEDSFDARGGYGGRSVSVVARELEFACRRMQHADLDDILSIERAGYGDPWSSRVFGDCLREGYSCWVLETDGVVNAFGILQHGATESRLLNLCVRKGLHRRGLGRRLLTHLICVARSHHSEAVRLEVRPGNAAARRLYESMGFSEIGRSRAYYPAHTGREDAVILALALT